MEPNNTNNPAEPRIEHNGSKEYTTCTLCGSATCYNQDECSFCQVAQQISDEDHKTWEFPHIVNWAVRLEMNLYQEVVILNTDVRSIDKENDEWTVFINFIDGSGKEQFALYSGKVLTHVNAKALKERVEVEEHLNGLYWTLT